MMITEAAYEQPHELPANTQPARLSVLCRVTMALGLAGQGIIGPAAIVEAAPALPVPEAVTVVAPAEPAAAPEEISTPPPPVASVDNMPEYIPAPLPGGLEHEGPPVDIEIPSAIPEFVQDEMAENTALIGNCSAWLVRNNVDVPVGFETARHCYDTEDGGIRKVIHPVVAQTGDWVDQMTTVQTADRLVLPETIEGLTQDNAIGLFPGTTTEEALANQGRMSVEEIRALQPNTPIYLSAWPFKQERNPTQVQRRQVWPLSVVDTEVTTDKFGRQIEIVWAALRTNEDGAECSYQASGAVGQAVGTDGELMGLGALAYFSDFTGEVYGNAEYDRTPEAAAAAQNYFEQKFHVNLQNVTTLCGFSISHLAADSSQLTNLHPLLEAPQTPLPPETGPAPTVPEEEAPLTEEQIKDNEAIQKATENFYDESADRIAINGWVKLAGPKDCVFIDKPLVYVDADNERIVIGREYVTGGKDGIWFSVIHPGTDYIEAFDVDGVPGLDFIDLQGELTPNDENGDLPGGVRGYKDENGTVFGDWRYGVQPDGIDITKSYSLHIVDRQLVTIANFIEPEQPPEEVPSTTTTAQGSTITTTSN